MPDGRWRFAAIGTTWEIDTPEELAPPVRERIRHLIDAFDAEWSRFRADSLVSRLGAAGGSIPAPADARAMLDAYAELDGATDGGVNPLVGESLARRGYGADYTFADLGARPAPPRWRDILSWSAEEITLAAPAVIDVGALGKGRLVDLVFEEIIGQVRPDASRSVTVDAGGDIRTSAPPQRIGLEHPYDPQRAIGVVEISNESVCASATNRRSWGEGLHHVLDARTGHPVRSIVATWAIAPHAMTADAVATALFFDGGPALADAWGSEWVRMTSTGEVQWSPGCRAELFGAGTNVKR